MVAIIMREESKITNKSAWDNANCIQKIFLAFVYPVFIRGYRQNGLNIEDMYRCSRHDESHHIVQQLESNWILERQKKCPTFWKALYRTYANYYWISVVMYTIEECVLRIGQPLLLGFVIDFFSQTGNVTYLNACLAAGGVCLCSALSTAIHHPTVHMMMRLAMRMRSSCCTLMYKKSLRLSRASMAKTTVGQIVNLMSNDMSRFDQYIQYCTYILYVLYIIVGFTFNFSVSYVIIAPIQTAIAIYIMYGYLSYYCFVGVGLLALLIPFQAFMGKLFSKIRLATAQLTDSRLKLMNEIITGMRVIKMYAWEQSFARLVATARKSEVGRIRVGFYLQAINLSIFSAASHIILFAVFITYVLTGNVLTAKAVFVSMSLFSSIRITATDKFPNAIQNSAELLVSCRRIQVVLTYVITFLELEERNESPFPTSSSPITHGATTPTLQNISFNLKPGDLLAVIGPVGAGKSSLLMTILKELPLLSGSIETIGSISYSCQESWSFNTSVRNNILFGTEYNKYQYKRVVEVCALERDFEIFPFGDKTLVGERGVQLSGGQKARITLASAYSSMQVVRNLVITSVILAIRTALYRNSDIVLMDDPLSAVDTSVAEHIFDKCIVDYLCDKIRILVTHQIQFIRKATQILVLNDEGKCLGLGSYDELQSRGLDFMSILSDQEKEADDKAIAQNRDLMVRTISADTVDYSEGSDDEFKNKKPMIEPKICDEKREIGSIEGRVYWEYIKAGAGPLLFSLTFMTEKFQEKTYQQIDYGAQNRDAIIYSTLIAALFVTVLIRVITWFMMCMRASVNLHNSIFYTLLRTPISFFDNNPVGRILNRFTKDMGTVDERLPSVGYELNMALTEIIGIVVVVAIVNPYLTTAALFLLIVALLVRVVYIKAARDIRRHEGIARSPVYTHVSTTLNGLASVRAYGAQTEFEKQYTIYQDDHTAMWFMYLCTTRMLAIVMDWFSVLYLVIVSIVLMVFYEGIGGGSAGLALSSALMLPGMAYWGVRQSAELENEMTSVERIIEYSKLPQEAALTAQDSHKPSPDWPQKGQIEFKDMSLCYEGSDKPVLKNLSCVIKSGEKVGIVGRTGAGKSSIISALF
ncbi:unnamed protein product, partial [Medioppia subpectinata]